MSPSPETLPQVGVSAGRVQISATLRHFTAATEVVGRSEERLDLPVGTTLAILREQLSGRGLEMARVILICSFLVNSISTPADSLTLLADDGAVDVLPSFADG